MKIELKSLDQIDPFQLAYHANHPMISTYLRNSFPYPYTIEHANHYIEYSIQNHCLDFGIVVDNQCIGCIGVTFGKDIYIKNCEIGYWISYEFWGQGIMHHVIEMICPYLFEHFSITKIVAEVFAENKASIKVLEDYHFQQEGYLHDHVYKDGKYHDVILFGLRKCHNGN